MDIIGQSSSDGTTFVIRRTGNAEAKSILDDLRREVESGRTRWFAVVGTGVETPDLDQAIETASVNLDREPNERVITLGPADPYAP